MYLYFYWEFIHLNASIFNSINNPGSDMRFRNLAPPTDIISILIHYLMKADQLNMYVPKSFQHQMIWKFTQSITSAVLSAAFHIGQCICIIEFTYMYMYMYMHRLESERGRALVEVSLCTQPSVCIDEGRTILVWELIRMCDIIILHFHTNFCNLISV